MHKLLPLLLLGSLALSGCSGGGDHKGLEPFTCADGTVLSSADQEAVADHHDADFDPADACPIPPSVTLTGLPAELGAFAEATFQWALDNGSIQHGHSMLASLRWSTTSVSEAELTDMTAYPEELVKREHQDLPVAFNGTLSFSVPGTVYLRAYAQIQGDGYDRQDFWSKEITLVILPVQPTGVVHDITHAPGNFLGALSPESLTIALGDGVRLVNDDVTEHALEFSSGPYNPGAIAAGQMADGEAVVFEQPGNYQFVSDDVQSRTVSITVTLPA